MNYLVRYHMRYGKLLPLIAALMLAGCVIPPAKDPAPVLNPPQAGDFARAGTAQWPAANWWKQFNDPQLDVLITRALAESPSMAVAHARFQQATASASGVAASSGASLAFDASVSRQLYTDNYIYPPPLGGAYDNSGMMDFHFSYDFDFWGRNRSALESAVGQVAAAQAETAGAAASLSAAIAKTYFQWQALNAHITMVQSIESQRNKLIQLGLSRVKSGIDPGDNLHALHADAAAPRQTLIQLETQREQTLYQLKSLVGGNDDLHQLKAVALPQVNADLPADLRLDLLARRPDVAAARDRIQASLSAVDSARAEFYPDISISAFLGLNSLRMGQLLRASSREQGITPAIHLPIFDAGRIRANLNMNRADAALAVAQYEQAVLSAVSDVNDAVVRLDGIARESQPLERQTEARQHDLQSVSRRVEAGLADKREVLRDQLSIVALQDQELTRHAQALAAQIDLIKALGGGYDKADADAKTQTKQ
ncbi:efflux transporter outer membrane subunit [Glaciimonas soli]|uniref:Efflux transporter outer membrane subunit n=1 Tax=Glaciimonas soli TaxID=2590999 RepID=A0A843YTM1_9BURK|nr:efflux transporter outer membrane subunit [Glaciimonas soli]MQR00848.1 efflux transporter outer membrane subunit [Glaciimonas soli]